MLQRFIITVKHVIYGAISSASRETGGVNFPLPLKFPDFFQFSLTCRNNVEQPVYTSQNCFLDRK